MNRILKSVIGKVVVIFFLGVILIRGEKLIKIQDLKTLENYHQLWNIDVKRIVDPVTSVAEGKEILKIKNEEEPFTGVMVLRKKKKIDGIYFYANGKKEKVYKYFKNGKIKNYTEYLDGAKERSEKAYNEKGKIISERKYIGDYVSSRTDYNNDGSILMKYNKGNGKMIYYYKGKDIINSEQEVKQEYSDTEGNTFIKDGETKIYSKNGTLEAIFLFKDNKLEGLPQKRFYPDGQLKIYTIAGNNDIDYLKASQKYIEYYENGEKKFYCNETSDRWFCEEYDKNGTLKGKRRIAPALKRNNGVAGEFFADMFLYIFFDSLFYHLFD